MKLTRIDKITGVIELQTGLHIGSGNTEMHIGGTDNPVVKHPVTGQPYIPGSSIKGKMRSLLEWWAGVVAETKGKPLGFGHINEFREATQKQRAKDILRLFGGAPESDVDTSLLKEIGPTRVAFWDCGLNKDWIDEIDEKNLLWTETKMENSIDRIKGVAENPRNTERVPAGAKFDFTMTLRVQDNEDLIGILLYGFKLLELSGLGGSGSRGYGKIRFEALSQNGVDLKIRLNGVAPFVKAA